MNAQADTTKDSCWRKAEFMLPLLLLLLHGIYYNTIGELASLRGVDFSSWLVTPLDHQLPFAPIFIIPYSAIWLLPVYMVLRLHRAGVTVQQIRRISVSFMGLILACYAFWLLFPVKMSMRMELEPGGWLTGLTAFTYHNATAWNAFPSFHVAAPWLICRVLGHYTGKLPAGVVLLTGAIFLATLGIRIHYIADIAGGILIAELVYRVLLVRLEKADALARIPSRRMITAYSLLAVSAGVAYLAIQPVLTTIQQ